MSNNKGETGPFKGIDLYRLHFTMDNNKATVYAVVNQRQDYLSVIRGL